MFLNLSLSCNINQENVMKFFSLNVCYFFKDEEKRYIRSKKPQTIFFSNKREVFNRNQNKFST